MKVHSEWSWNLLSERAPSHRMPEGEERKPKLCHSRSRKNTSGMAGTTGISRLCSRASQKLTTRATMRCAAPATTPRSYIYVRSASARSPYNSTSSGYRVGVIPPRRSHTSSESIRPVQDQDPPLNHRLPSPEGAKGFQPHVQLGVHGQSEKVPLRATLHQMVGRYLLATSRTRPDIHRSR